MKNPDRKAVSTLEDLPNIGKAMANELQLIGFDHPKKLIGKDPFILYDKLCRATGKENCQQALYCKGLRLKSFLRPGWDAECTPLFFDGGNNRNYLFRGGIFIHYQ